MVTAVNKIRNTAVTFIKRLYCCHIDEVADLCTFSAFAHSLLLMPADGFDPETAREWIADLRNQEMAEMAATLLFSKLTYAPSLALDAMHDANALTRIFAFNLMARLVTNGYRPEEKLLEDVIGCIAKEMQGDNLKTKHAAFSCGMKMDNADILADNKAWHNMCLLS